MTDIDYNDLDPGIRDTVRLLRTAGFETTDSGDGGKTDMECSIEFPHVFCELDLASFVSETNRAQRLLGDEWTAEARYSAKDGKCILLCMKYPQNIQDFI